MKPSRRSLTGITTKLHDRRTSNFVRYNHAELCWGSDLVVVVVSRVVVTAVIARRNERAIALAKTQPSEPNGITTEERKDRERGEKSATKTDGMEQSMAKQANR
uniref:(northern house mosquito) hypothetical protein n=1 Tax=Culex pipiens TaxID=7175 RepID=A0A8D8B157_CULPI